MHLLSLVVLVIIVVVVLILAAAVFVVGMAIWSALCAGTVCWLRPKGKRWPWLVATIPLFIPAYLVTAAVLAWAAWPDDRDHFTYAFDMPVPPTVQIHEAEVSGWGDYEDTYLHFSATPADITAITSRGLTLDPNYGTQQLSAFIPPNGSGPIPWAQLVIYTGGSPNQRFHSEEARLIYHPNRGEAWYWYDGVD
ncbi:hypothetical protein OT109_09040 [Phycisphaeraceae bacterium D3-23]